MTNLLGLPFYHGVGYYRRHHRADESNSHYHDDFLAFLARRAASFSSRASSFAWSSFAGNGNSSPAGLIDTSLFSTIGLSRFSVNNNTESRMGTFICDFTAFLQEVSDSEPPDAAWLGQWLSQSPSRRFPGSEVNCARYGGARLLPHLIARAGGSASASPLAPKISR